MSEKAQALASLAMAQQIVDRAAERDHWIRLFNRLEAAVSHHKKATAGFATDADEALWKARDLILAAAASPSSQEKP